jgi:superfamily II DNA or RNA helicase
MVELWPFQNVLVAGVRQALRQRFTAPLIVSPTGSGKTHIFSFLASRLAMNGFRLMILAHRKELLDQISRTLTTFRVKHGMIEPGSTYNSLAPVHVASVFSVVRKLDYIKTPDYVIIDEAHHAIPGSTWNKTLDTWREANPKMRCIGVTATPERLSGEGLGDTFDTMIEGPSVSQLISEQYLSPYRMFAPQRPVDLSGVHRRMGDFVKGEVEARMDKPVITGNAIAHYRKHLNGAPTVAFCVSVEHAHHVAEDRGVLRVGRTRPPRSRAVPLGRVAGGWHRRQAEAERPQGTGGRLRRWPAECADFVRPDFRGLRCAGHDGLHQSAAN